MSALRCSICRKARRRGSSRRIAILSDGMVANGIACAECAGRAVLVAVPPAERAPPPDTVRDVLIALASTYRGHAKLARMAGEMQAAIIWEAAADWAKGRAIHPEQRRLGTP